MTRDATTEDIPRLIEMGKRFVAETNYRGKIEIDDARCDALIRPFVGAEGRLFVVHEVRGELAGMLAAFLYEHPFSGERTCCEMFWWIEPEHRGGGVRLMRHMENWALENGAVLSQMVAPSERVGKFYEAMGYEKVESAYQRRFKKCQ